MFARGGIKGQRGFVLYHNPIGAEVNPAFIRVPGDCDDSGTNVSAAVMGMPLGGRKLIDINIISFQDILPYWPVFHLHRGHRLKLVPLVFPFRHAFDVDHFLSKAEGQFLTYPMVHQVCGNTESLRITFNIVKDQSRPLPFGHQFVNRSYLKVPIGITYTADLAPFI